MNNHYLVCTDLDRTLIPNGHEPESPQARPLFARIVAREDVRLAYVTGRHREIVLEAIQQYQLPVPDYVIGDVGTSIYETHGEEWKPLSHWHDVIAGDWAGRSGAQLAELVDDQYGLTLQEPEKQNDFKLSYYTPRDLDVDGVCTAIRQRLRQENISANLVWSVDELNGIGLLDILPASASKLHAIEFLAQEQGFEPKHILFSGDSGNDIQVLASHVQSVLVANASEEVRQQALDSAVAAGEANQLYIARGGLLGMNGNYAAGIVEGMLHYFPPARDWIVS